jgi:hypothetical protein
MSYQLQRHPDRMANIKPLHPFSELSRYTKMGGGSGRREFEQDMGHIPYEFRPI